MIHTAPQILVPASQTTSSPRVLPDVVFPASRERMDIHALSHKQNNSQCACRHRWRAAEPEGGATRSGPCGAPEPGRRPRRRRQPARIDEFSFNQAHWPIEPPHLLIDCLHEIDVKVEDWSVAHGDLACLRLLTKLRRADLTLTDAFVLDDAQDGPVAADPGLHQLEALMLRQCSRLSVSSILQQPQAALPQLTHLARSLWRGGEPG